MEEKIREIIGKEYLLKYDDRLGISAFKVQGMKFCTTHFDAKGLGSVSVMKASGMLGLMNMMTVVVNPFLVDAPLISYDCINVCGKSILYLEMFDTTLEKVFDAAGLEKIQEGFKKLTSHELGKHWYDSMRVGTPVCVECKKKEKVIMDKLCLEYFEEYVRACKKAPACDEDKKRKKASEYSEGLLKNGGPATDPVKKKLGEEAAAEFFRKYLFATDK